MAEEVSSLKYSSTRISGLASGLDTESMIENLMKAERQKVIKVEQELAYANWQQEAYRGVIQKLSDFTKSQFNLSDNSKNILSNSNLKTVNMTSKDYVTVLANGDAVTGQYTINEIVQVAKPSTLTSSSSIKNGINGTKDMSLPSLIEVEGMSFYARLDGEQFEISFDSNYSDSTAFMADLQDKLDDAFGQGRVAASLDENSMINLSSQNSTLQILDNSESAIKLDYLGLRSGDMSILNIRGSMLENFGSNDEVSFRINGTEFSFSSTESIENIMNTVNESAAKVKMTYNSITDKISISSAKTGSNSYIDIENLSGSFFGADGFIKISDGITANGQDAMFYLNDAGKENLITRSSNTFTIDNLTYTLKKENAATVNFSIENNVDDVYESIKSFIDEYNGIVAELTGHVMEKRDYDYKPLSDEQKEEMTEAQIADWEDKAKEGLLKADSMIFSMLNELRTAFTSGIKNLNMTFGSIGINTSDYTNNGIISIDETVLKGAIEGRFDEVVDMFSRESSVKYTRDLSTADTLQRFNESGFSQRVNDIIKKYITVTRDEDGNKGLLIEKAGIINDASEGSNALTRRIDEIKKRLEEANDEMDNKERRYWSQFTDLEMAIHKMNTQSSYVTSMMEK
ncbi:MAG: flagellar filament capping protein FliD [Clostridia bacterium]|jgi:flagellar hook-associated protein 2